MQHSVLLIIFTKMMLIYFSWIFKVNWSFNFTDFVGKKIAVSRPQSMMCTSSMMKIWKYDVLIHKSIHNGTVHFCLGATGVCISVYLTWHSMMTCP